MIDFFRTILYIPLYNLYIALVDFIPGHSVVVAILLVTAIVRIILTPLKHKSIESQAKQKELQPELKEIQSKFKGDKAAQGQATMQLYKDKGINPASGCLPLLIQFPVIIVLYYVFRTPISPDQQNMLYSFVNLPVDPNYAFFWIKDVTARDPYLILPILAGIIQFFYSRSMIAIQPMSSDSGDMASIMNKQMMYMFPIMTVFIGASLPAALSFYWVVATGIDWYQQEHAMKKYHAKVVKQGKVSVSVRSKKTKGTK